MGYCCRNALVGLAAEHSWFLIYPSHCLEPVWQLLGRTKRMLSSNVTHAELQQLKGVCSFIINEVLFEMI